MRTHAYINTQSHKLCK